MLEDIRKVLISREQIRARVGQLGEMISHDYKGSDLVVVGVLNGGVVFAADLVREITIPLTLDFISVSSYGKSTESTGIVRILKDLDTDIRNRNVLIVEDLIDTGLTRGPCEIKVCALLDKISRRKVDVTIEYRGFEIPDEFVVGYGLDFAGKYRNLPGICVLKPSVYKRQ